MMGISLKMHLAAKQRFTCILIPETLIRNEQISLLRIAKNMSVLSSSIVCSAKFAFRRSRFDKSFLAVL